mmetsp:Transcript_6299/g.22412  ORF Transcript_6299/g.22412 Transcript_6299/m.22412 type:complete len:532 (-) Transcript_6299:1567-3162(-)
MHRYSTSETRAPDSTLGLSALPITARPWKASSRRSATTPVTIWNAVTRSSLNHATTGRYVNTRSGGTMAMHHAMYGAENESIRNAPKPPTQPNATTVHATTAMLRILRWWMPMVPPTERMRVAFSGRLCTLCMLRPPMLPSSPSPRGFGGLTKNVKSAWRHACSTTAVAANAGMPNIGSASVRSDPVMRCNRMPAASAHRYATMDDTTAMRAARADQVRWFECRNAARYTARKTMYTTVTSTPARPNSYCGWSALNIGTVASGELANQTAPTRAPKASVHSTKSTAGVLRPLTCEWYLRFFWWWCRWRGRCAPERRDVRLSRLNVYRPALAYDCRRSSVAPPWPGGASLLSFGATTMATDTSAPPESSTPFDSLAPSAAALLPSSPLAPAAPSSPASPAFPSSPLASPPSPPPSPPAAVGDVVVAVRISLLPALLPTSWLSTSPASVVSSPGATATSTSISSVCCDAASSPRLDLRLVCRLAVSASSMMPSDWSEPPGAPPAAMPPSIFKTPTRPTKPSPIRSSSLPSPAS